jgi:hypothetical protein
MRGLHRPLHDKFIFAKDWALMSEKERTKATNDGKYRLPSTKEMRTMTKEQWKEWKIKFKPIIEELHNNALNVFRNFPKSLLLVCRYK